MLFDRLFPVSYILEIHDLTIIGKETTAYDMGLAHEAAGMREIKEGGYTTEVKLQKQSGGGTWNYLTATGSSPVDWDFDGAGKADYYGGTGTAGNDRMVYSGAFSRSFSGERVDFARKPAAGTSHASIVSIPFFPVAACW